MHYQYPHLLRPCNESENNRGEGVRINSQCEICHSLDYWTCNQTLYSKNETQTITMQTDVYNHKQQYTNARQQLINLKHSSRNFQDEFQNTTYIWLNLIH